MYCEKFDKELMKAISSPSPKRKQIYHYTTVENFYGIMTSRTLWMNSYRNHIDHEEIKLGKKLSLSGLIEISAPSDVINGLEQCYDYGFFCATSSFCARKDIHEMWNYYADKFNGVVVKFNINIYDKVNGLEKQFNSNDVRPKKKIIASEVEYQPSGSNKNTLIDKILSQYNNHTKSCKGEHHLPQLCAYMLALSTIIKHDYYNHEEEYRICCFAVALREEEELKAHPIRLKRETVIFPDDNPKDYRVLFPIDHQDISTIYLINKNYDTRKNEIVEKLKLVTGIDYSKKIRKITIEESEIDKFLPHKIELYDG